MDLSELRHLDATETLKLSDAIRAGQNLVPESRDNFIGCALGAAFRARSGRLINTGDVLRAHMAALPMSHYIATVCGWPREVCQEINLSHQVGMSMEQCAFIAERNGV